MGIERVGCPGLMSCDAAQPLRLLNWESLMEEVMLPWEGLVAHCSNGEIDGDGDGGEGRVEGRGEGGREDDAVVVVVVVVVVRLISPEVKSGQRVLQ